MGPCRDSRTKVLPTIWSRDLAIQSPNANSSNALLLAIRSGSDVVVFNARNKRKTIPLNLHSLQPFLTSVFSEAKRSSDLD